MGPLKQLQRPLEDLLAHRELLLGLGYGAPDVALLIAQSLDFGSELVLGPPLIGGEIKEVIFFLIQYAEPMLKPLPHVIAQAGVRGYGLQHCRAKLRPEVRWQPDGPPVVILYSPLDHLDGYIGVVAYLFLTAPAEPIEVGAAVTFAWLDNKSVTAAITPDSAFEVMMVDSLAGARTLMRV